RCCQLMRRHGEKPLLQAGHFVEQSLELPAREAAELCWRQRFGTVGICLVVDQSEKVASKEKSGDLPPAVTQQLVDFHCPLSDVIDMFGRVGLIEYGAMRLDIDGSHHCCEAGLFTGSKRGAGRKLPGFACV